LVEIQALISRPIRSKNQNQSYRVFPASVFPRLAPFGAFALTSDWFSVHVLLVPVVVGQRYDFGFDFMYDNRKPL